ncbi:hypothetical protein kac65v162_gp078 [Nodularia phage vB_NspS-kac65v162]|jgi:hypothetical protein|uniref:Uncharacterized protein n=3 Tax=Ravarandavirus kac65v151 TaxID=2845689 RepID=A0A482MID0_9CAUD|nr:hypothetical protein HWC12_gp078 [Nodularia phage vB_NspS-kac65v151]QBQ73108.1 hypothetical protein kac65v151_gp078 [Nodularia phage vB_NspS-kac65v151]QBQ73316.1 hypothetical protein kac65v161_gp078 [Nodularia phage vB_NspS-kac65v161]QBQ73522.1 hypothetical protein kac65v162_gp078 [Nodularia phage vB_NspS-kac65v162]
MLQIIKVISSTQQQQIREYLDQHQQLLQRDVSSYAKGRQRFWLKSQPTLDKEPVFNQAHKLPRLWDWCSTIFDRAMQHTGLDYQPKSALGLVAYGSVGINWHRDATYADYPAVSINLTSKSTLWGYQAMYPGYCYGKQDFTPERETFELPSGAVVLFNCKNPHAAIRCASDRYSINLWSINPKLSRVGQNKQLDLF